MSERVEIVCVSIHTRQGGVLAHLVCVESWMDK